MTHRKTIIKAVVTASAFAAFALSAPIASANLDLAKAKNCTACHAVDKKVLGPAFAEIATKYAADKAGTGKLAEKIIKGSVGAWGQIPMPPNANVSAAEADALVKWIMSTKK
jgi:cytochrome c